MQLVRLSFTLLHCAMIEYKAHKQKNSSEWWNKTNVDKRTNKHEQLLEKNVNIYMGKRKVLIRFVTLINIIVYILSDSSWYKLRGAWYF